MKRLTHPLHLVIGLTAWAAWFVTAYGAVSLACAWAPPPVDAGARTWVNAGLLALMLGTAALLLLAAAACWRARRGATDGHANARPATADERFVATVSAGLYLTAAVATIVVGLPLVALPPCA